MTEARMYLVAYDVASPKRWRRVIKLVRPFCGRAQLSVFLCRATKARIARFETDMRLVMHHRDDRLMIVDMGPAESAALRLTIENSASDLARIGAAIL